MYLCSDDFIGNRRFHGKQTKNKTVAPSS